MVEPKDHLTANLASSRSAENNNVDDRPEIRQPRSLQDLLRYAVEAGQVGEAGNVAQAEIEPQGPLDHERMEFLERALKSLTVDVAQELARAIAVLRQLPSDGEDTSKSLEAFETISNFVDNIDAANDFYKLGGFDIVRDCIESPHDDIRCRICEIVADCCQNNPFCQEQAVRMGFLKLLSDVIREPRRGATQECCTTAFYAISNIVRAYPPGWEEFLKGNGLEIVAKALTSDHSRLRTKAAFFLSSKVSENKDVIVLLRQHDFVGLLVDRIRNDAGQCREWTLETLKNLVESDVESRQEARSERFHLKETLTRLDSELAEDDANREQLTYVKQLKQLLFLGQ